MLDNLENKIIKEIESKQVKPFSSSFFLMKRIIVWLLITIFLILAGLSLAILALTIRYGDWDIYRFLNFSPAAFFLRAFPYFWLIGLLAFLLAAFYRTRRVDGAYSHPLIYHGLIGFMVIILFAGIFYYSGLGQKIETRLAESPVYREANYLRASWDNPDKGLLAGTLEKNETGMSLRDFNNQIWNLIIPNINFAGQELLVDGKKIKLIGTSNQATSSNFYVEEARPWECGCPHCTQTGITCTNCTADTCGLHGSCGAHNR